MTHSQIVAFLKAQALEAGAASFWEGKKAAANINYDAPFPQAHLFLMPSRLKGDTITTQVAMCFYGKDEHEHGSDESVGIQSEMDLLTQAFHGLFAEADEVELLDGTMERAPVLRAGAAIGTGYFVNFTLTHLKAC